MAKRRKTKSYAGSSISLGVNNLVGIGMIGATAGMVNSLPSGTAKTLAGVVPSLQATALLGENLKFAKSKAKKSTLW